MTRFIVFLVLIASRNLIAQSTDESTKTINFNRWSIELNGGQNKAVRPFSDGYYSADSDTYFSFSGVNHYDLGARYMLSEYFGIKASLGYDMFEDLRNSGSLPFKTDLYSFSLQGVINIGHVLKFDTFSKRIGLLVHGGVQVSRMYIDRPDLGKRDEDNGGVVFGVTPQVKLASWLALTGDFTIVNNVRQHLTWDGAYSPSSENLTGVYFHTSLGLTFYLGSKEEHADWYFEPLAEKNSDEEARKRLDSIETMLNDTDKDGVPDYLDTENNTPNGVAVDSKGRYIDLNNNGVPDELEPRRGNNDSERVDKESKTNAVALLLENGNYNVFYETNSDTPDVASSNSIYQIIQYMKQQSGSKIKLTGYADVTGNEKANKQLSLRRAQNLKKLFTSAGIADNRIEISGNGADTKLPPSGVALRLARRVSIELIK